MFRDHFRLNVNTVDTILVDGEPYRRLGIGCVSYYEGDTDYSNGNTQQYWVEGIGSDVGPDPEPGFLWVTSSYMTFDSCKVDGKLLFTSNDFLRIPHCDRQWICADYRKTNHIEDQRIVFSETWQEKLRLCWRNDAERKDVSEGLFQQIPFRHAP